MKPRGAIGLVVGTAIEAFGLLFLLQGAGLVRWPASSFMIDQRIWIAIGAAMIAVGIATTLRSLRDAR